MLIFPTPRIGTCTIGAGATTPAPGRTISCREVTASTRRGGATAACGRPSLRDVAWLTAGGGGATTQVRPAGAVNGKRLASESRIALGAGTDAAVSGDPVLVILMSDGGLMLRVRRCASAVMGLFARSFRTPGRARIRGPLLPSAGNDWGGV